MNPFSRKAKLANEMAHQQSYSAEPYREGMDYTDEAWAYGLRALPGSLANQLQALGEYTTGKDYPNYAGNYLDELTQVNEMGYTPQTEYEAGVAFLPELVYDPAIVAGAPYAAYKGLRSAPKLMNVLADEAGRTTMRNQLGIIKNPLLDESAKAHFGRTFSPDETGYIMDDGMRLDFSGRHYATGYEQTPMGFKAKPGQPDYLRGSRGVDHRELGDLMEEGGTEAMLKFMDESGAVRYMPNTGITVSSTNLPSRFQIEQVVKDFRRSGETLYVDVDDINKGYAVASKEFDRPTVDEVYEFIKSNQAASGEPLGNLGAFKSQLGAVDLPMDEVSRMARAREMGFDTDAVAYHGTHGEDFSEFSPATFGDATGSGDKGFFFVDDPIDTQYFAEGIYDDFRDGARVMPNYIRMENPLDLNQLDPDDLNIFSNQDAIDYAIKHGHDGIDFGPYGSFSDPGRVRVVFDPKNIRSRFAKFDPAKKDSADLLASKLLPIPAGLLGLTTLDPEN